VLPSPERQPAAWRGLANRTARSQHAQHNERVCVLWKNRRKQSNYWMSSVRARDCNLLMCARARTNPQHKHSVTRALSLSPVTLPHILTSTLLLSLSFIHTPTHAHSLIHSALGLLVGRIGGRGVGAAFGQTGDGELFLAVGRRALELLLNETYQCIAAPLQLDR
jgi:hypothetical protein